MIVVGLRVCVSSQAALEVRLKSAALDAAENEQSAQPTKTLRELNIEECTNALKHSSGEVVRRVRRTSVYSAFVVSRCRAAAVPFFISLRFADSTSAIFRRQRTTETKTLRDSTLCDYAPRSTNL